MSEILDAFRNAFLANSKKAQHIVNAIVHLILPALIGVGKERDSPSRRTLENGVHAYSDRYTRLAEVVMEETS